MGYVSYPYIPRPGLVFSIHRVLIIDWMNGRLYTDYQEYVLLSIWQSEINLQEHLWGVIHTRLASYKYDSLIYKYLD